MPNYKLCFLISLFWGLSLCNLHAQQTSVITSNDSFEGFQQTGVPPNHWNNCNDELSTADTQPGAWNVNKQASHGKTYISLLAREISQPGTAETVWTKLKQPLLKDSCLTFGIDLCISNEFRATFNFETYSFNNPCRLRVWGFNNSCNDKSEFELLWESDIISHNDWRTYNVECKPKNGNITKIAFQPWFIDSVTILNSALLLDHMRPVPDEIVFVDGELMVPEGATNIQWFYNGNPIIGADTTYNLVPFRDGYYQVYYTDPDGCKRFTRTTYIKTPSTEIQVWPNPGNGEGEIYIFSTTNGRQFFDLYVYDTAGRLVHKQAVNLSFGPNMISYDFRHLAAGAYHLVLDSAEFADKIHTRFIIQK